MLIMFYYRCTIPAFHLPIECLLLLLDDFLCKLESIGCCFAAIRSGVPELHISLLCCELHRMFHRVDLHLVIVAVIRAKLSHLPWRRHFEMGKALQIAKTNWDRKIGLGRWWNAGRDTVARITEGERPYFWLYLAKESNCFTSRTVSPSAEMMP